jgi:hypothetical protein
VPDPASVDRRRLRLTSWPAGTVCWSATSRRHAPARFNDSPTGDSRFSPLADRPGAALPALYLARSQTVAVLETAFHDVHASGGRLVSMPIDLAPRSLTRLVTPVEVVMVDLRDDALDRLGLGREQLVATFPSHYPCTRRWASALVGTRRGSRTAEGLLWRSRVAEIARADHLLLDDLLAGSTAEVAMLVGSPSTGLPIEGSRWSAVERFDRLDEGAGLVFAEELATLLGATIVPV